ncbi:MAG: caspase family protein [Alphaproteobacteria bacterium TMED89]|nr:hypothetical protein [Rhodospirillaceae bacterium]RPH15467.1 MAG: caspase family protein [Alphaproteobacteria bacterium TMED89]
MPRLMLFFIAVSLWLPVPAHSLKIALSVGIDDYGGYGDLDRAVADASAVADTLDGLGYSSSFLPDVTLYAFLDYLDTVTNNLSADDTVVLFFSGHGVNVQGANAIIFADHEQVLVEDVLRIIRAGGVRTAVLILDACRNYPEQVAVTRSLNADKPTSFSSTLSGNRGSFILYSAGAGQYAFDSGGYGDEDPNSFFTRELLKLMPEPDMSIRDLSIELRQNVEALAADFGLRQTPAYYDELVGDFSFAVAGAVTSDNQLDQDATKPQQSEQESSDCAEKSVSFASIVTSTADTASCK